eukprot:GHVN01034544.1.p1 GENE.GHVN01034544.1~~GHVN01034544.1.p1  ORF type:complete len:1561 (-),score=256.45 GHVN01034544.1:395-5077(-)
MGKPCSCSRGPAESSSRVRSPSRSNRNKNEKVLGNQAAADPVYGDIKDSYNQQWIFPPHHIVDDLIYEFPTYAEFFVNVSGLKTRSLLLPSTLQSSSGNDFKSLTAPYAGVSGGRASMGSQTSTRPSTSSGVGPHTLDIPHKPPTMNSGHSPPSSQPSPQPHSSSSMVSISLNWDDLAPMKTKTVRQASPMFYQWLDQFQFTWKISVLDLLELRTFTVILHEHPYGQKATPVDIGYVKIKLVDIATGPLHHELSVTPYNANVGYCGKLVMDVRMEQICQLIINPVEILCHIHEIVDIDQLDSATGPQRDESGDYSPRRKPPLPTGSNVSDSHRGKSEGTTSSSSANSPSGGSGGDPHGEDEDVDVEVDSDRARRLERSATGGHAEDDDIGLLSAQWQLSVTPTGTPGTTCEYFSTWTEMTDKPYWNSVRMITSSQQTPIQSATYTQAPGFEDALARRQAFYASIQSRAGSKSGGKNYLDDKSCLSPGGLSHSSLSGHQHHTHTLNTQETYSDLARICRRGHLVSGMLSDDLPTLQLQTTTDQLRQNHVHVRLYAKRLGMTQAKLYGETWLPFIKIYDSDVVERMDKHFFDACFHEKLWLEGRCIGFVEGMIVFQNNPKVRQMFAGVNTDTGYQRISPPILGSEHKTVDFDPHRDRVELPGEVTRIQEYHKELLDFLYTRGQHSHQEVFSGILTDSKPASRQPSQVAPPSSSSRPSQQQGDDSSQYRFQYILERLLEELKSSHAETRRSFLYKNVEALLASQSIFLNLANHLVDYLDSILWQYRATYCAIAHHILRRSELDIGTLLPQLPRKIRSLPWAQVHKAYKRARTLRDSPHSEVGEGVIESDSGDRGEVARHASLLSTHSEPERGDSDPDIDNLIDAMTADERSEIILFHKQMKLCLQYYLLLHKLLHYSLQKICGDPIFERQRKYLSLFLCSAYFRLPKFRRELLQCILTKEERGFMLDEWRGTEFELNSQTLDNCDKWLVLTDVQVFLDWSEFHNDLKGYWGSHPTAENLENQVKNLSKKAPEGWTEKFSKRGNPFFFFLEHWSKHIFQEVIHSTRKEFIRWQYIPGYPILLKGLLLEMRTRDVTKYPDALLNCSGAMLANERVLSVFIKILFTRTSVFHSAAVFSAMNYVDYWIQVLTMRKKPLPPNFDFHFLRKGLDILLGCDMCLNVAKAIWFIYKNLPVFSGHHLKIILIDLMINKYFAMLFLNWSWLVRKCFMWFLLYRVYEGVRKIMCRWRQFTRDSKAKFKLNPDEKVLYWSYHEIQTKLRQMKTLSSTSSEIEAQCLAKDPLLIYLTNLAMDNDDEVEHGSPDLSHAASPSLLARARSIQGDDNKHGGPVNFTRVYSSHDGVSNSSSSSPLYGGIKGGSTRNSSGSRGWQGAINGFALLPPQATSCRSTSSDAHPSHRIQSPSPLPPQNNSHTTDSPPSSPSRLNLTLPTHSTSSSSSHPSPSLIMEACASVAAQAASPTQRNSVNIEQRRRGGIGEEFRSAQSPLLVIPDTHTVYIQWAIPELNHEVREYNDWVKVNNESAKAQIPTMHIPASPLDYNVDVPLDW